MIQIANPDQTRAASQDELCPADGTVLAADTPPWPALGTPLQAIDLGSRAARRCAPSRNWPSRSSSGPPGRRRYNACTPPRAAGSAEAGRSWAEPLVTLVPPLPHAT
jgi:hypothetical protein